MRHPVLILTAFLLLLAGIGVTVFGVSARQRSLSELEATLQRLEAEGYGRTPQDLYATAPATDPERQARAWTWATRDRPTSRPGIGRDWYLKGETRPDPKVMAWREATRPDMDVLVAMLEEGPICLSALGWPPDGIESDAWRPLNERMPRIPSLLALRQAYDYFGLEALLAEAPGKSLGVLDRLHESVGRPGTLIDALIAVACDAMRDDIHLQLARSGALPSARLERWAAEPPRAAPLVADAFRGERLGFLAPVYEGMAQGKTYNEAIGATEADSFENVLHDVRTWVRGPARLAKIVRAEAAIEGYLRGALDEDALLEAWTPLRDLSSPFEMMVPNLEALLYSAYGTATMHRATRAAALLTARGRREGRVPASEAEARAWLADGADLLDGGRLVAPLRYEKLGPKRFRLARDPEAEIPALIRGTYGEQLARPVLGTPSSGCELHVSGSHSSIEVALP